MVKEQDVPSRLSAAPQPLIVSRRRRLAAVAAFTGAAAAAGAATFAYSLLIEPQMVELERLHVQLPNAAGRLPPDGLRILHLSDSHFSGRNWREKGKIERVRKLLRGVECDLLIHTGDFMHYDTGLPNIEALLDILPQPRLGAYAVFGNHDYTHYNMKEALPRMWHTFRAKDQAWAAGANAPLRTILWATRWPRYVRYVRNTPLDGRRTGSNNYDALTSLLARRNMRVMHNQVVHLDDPQRGLDLYLAGIDDVYEGRPRLGETLDCVPAGAPLVLLSHNPDVIASPRLDRIDLVLAGHTHGGQLVLPFWGPAHTQSAYLSRRNVSGYFSHGRTKFYISRGMGEGIPLRFNARPQITLITLAA
jgi:predicted MPP superfamily phosphohydrolase